jgi:NAD(P)-dependent dehydrogenase (short-subunit alcohol dehydrogenase family)
MSESVLITGAAGNMGKAVCKKFLDEGTRVTAVIGPSDDQNFISHKNLQVHAVDLFKEKEAEKSLKHIVGKYGPYSFAVFTVGGFTMGSMLETDLGSVREMMQLNFETAYSSSRVLFQHFKDEGIKGRMILIGARPGLNLRQAKEVVAYGLSKSLIFNLAEIINHTGHESGIDAAVIVPSIIDTPSNRKSMPDADFSKWVTPGQLAENIYFLSTTAGRKQRKAVFKIYGDS